MASATAETMKHETQPMSDDGLHQVQYDDESGSAETSEPPMLSAQRPQSNEGMNSNNGGDETKTSQSQADGLGNNELQSTATEQRDDEACYTLCVRNLPADLRTEHLREEFSRFGEVVDSRVVINPVTKDSRGFGFVSFRTPQIADQAMAEMDGFELSGKVLKIEKAKRNRPHDPTPGEYKGPAGASIKYDNRGRLKPGYVPYWDLPVPRHFSHQSRSDRRPSLVPLSDHHRRSFSREDPRHQRHVESYEPHRRSRPTHNSDVAYSRSSTSYHRSQISRYGADGRSGGQWPHRPEGRSSSGGWRDRYEGSPYAVRRGPSDPTYRRGSPSDVRSPHSSTRMVSREYESHPIPSKRFPELPRSTGRSRSPIGKRGSYSRGSMSPATSRERLTDYKYGSRPYRGHPGRFETANGNIKHEEKYSSHIHPKSIDEPSRFPTGKLNDSQLKFTTGYRSGTPPRDKYGMSEGGSRPFSSRQGAGVDEQRRGYGERRSSVNDVSVSNPRYRGAM